MKRKALFKLSLPISLTLLAVISPLSLASCSSNGIILANFESYMSPELMNRLRNDHSVNFVNYSTNEDILAKFAHSYDIAVPSTYSVLELIKNGFLGEIDWAYLSSNYQLTANPERKEGIDLKPITNALPRTSEYDPLNPENTDNAQWLFSDTIDNIIDAVDEYAHNAEHQYYPADKSILNYAIPYFLQDWMFAYHGDYIEDLPSPTPHEVPDDPDREEWYSELPSGQPISWEDITNVIGPKIGTTDQRFKPTSRGPNMTMVDDSRTVYDMSHLIYDIQNHNPNPSINPNITPNNDETTIPKIEDVYKRLTDKFNPNTFRLNSDSQQVLYSFAKPRGDADNATEADANGIIAYNGDVLYATMGAGIEKWEDTWYCDPETDEYPLVNGNTHIVKPKNTPVALDMMVINKKVNGSSKRQAVYDILEKTLLDGCDLPSETDGEASDEPWIGSLNDNDEFTYGSTLNFDFVAYTPTLWNLNKFVARDVEDPNEYNSYFDMLYPDDGNKAELLAEINNVNFGPNDGQLLELPLSNLAKSNMSMVYMQYKEKI